MTPSVSRSEIQARAVQFAHDWHGETRERAEKDTFWNEFLAIFGIKRRDVAAFEHSARRRTQGGSPRGRSRPFQQELAAVLL